MEGIINKIYLKLRHGVIFMKFLKIVVKAAIWILLCLLPVAVFQLYLELSDSDELQNLFLFSFYLFMVNPLYLAGVSYYFINKKSAIFMYLALISPQILWFIPYFRNSINDWPMIAEMELTAGIYQIIGITLCFAIACFIKCISFRHKNGVKWFLLCFVPSGCFYLVDLLLIFTKYSTVAVVAFLFWMVAEPIYTAIVSYRFAAKGDILYKGFILLVAQLIWFIPIGDDLNIGLIKIVSTVICYGIACVIKYN